MPLLGSFRRPHSVWLVFLLVLIPAAIIVWNLLAPSNDVRIEALRKKGYPVTLAELDAAYQTPAQSENAAFLYTNAFAYALFASNRLDTLSKDWVPSRGQRVAPADKQAFRELLSTNTAALELLYQAASIPHCRYPINLKNGYRTLLPHLAPAKSTVTVLSNEALLKAEEGNLEGALRDFSAASSIAESLAEEPLLISQLVRYSLWAIICNRLERCLNLPDKSFDSAQLAQLQEMIGRGEKSRSLAIALVGERVQGLSVFTDPRFQNRVLSPMDDKPKESERISAQFMIGALKATGIFSRDKAFYLDSMGGMIEGAECPYPQRWERSQVAGMPVPDRLAIISRLILPALTKAVNRDAEYTARIRVTLTGLAVERFCRDHTNSLPDKLDQLAPACLAAVSADPFDGAPLRYKKLPVGYVVYSLGPDGVDNNGTERNPRKYGTPYDVTFIVER